MMTMQIDADGDRKKPFHMCFDEAWFVRGEQTGVFIETLARRLRMPWIFSGGDAKYQDFYKTPEPGTFENSD